MSSAQITYDTRSGRIISFHYGNVDTSHARRSAQHFAKISEEEYIAVMAVPSEGFERGKQYKVDVSTKTVVEAAPGEGGAGFSFGTTGRSY